MSEKTNIIEEKNAHTKNKQKRKEGEERPWKMHVYIFEWINRVFLCEGKRGKMKGYCDVYQLFISYRGEHNSVQMHVELSYRNMLFALLVWFGHQDYKYM